MKEVRGSGLMGLRGSGLGWGGGGSALGLLGLRVEDLGV